MNQIIEYFQHQLTTNQFAQAGAITAAISSILVAIGVYARTIPLSIWRRIIRLLHFQARVEFNDAMFRYVEMYLRDKYPSSFRNVEIETSTKKNPKNYAPKDEIPEDIKFAHDNDYIRIWKNRRRLTISKTKEKLTHADSVFELYNRYYIISGLFAKSTIIELLSTIYKYGIEQDKVAALSKKEISLYEPTYYGSWNTSKILKGKTFDDLFFTDKSSLVEDLNAFKSRQEVYEHLKIPFKRGYLFYGSPGNGKSSIVYAMANYLKYDVYQLNLDGITSEYFLGAFNNIPANSILLVEDIDSFFNLREPINGNKINFSTFINALSGIEKKENIITVFTTNHIDKLDPALVRDGRCDYKLELTNPDSTIISQFLSHVYSSPIEINTSPNKCFAEIQNIVLKNIDNVEQAKQEILC